MAESNDELSFNMDKSFDYNKLNEISRKEIVKLMLIKIGELSTKEFSEGYVEKKPVNIGGAIVITEVRHPDTRWAYINSVNYLYDLLIPFIYKKNTDGSFKYPDMVNIESKINERINIIREDYLKKGKKYTELVDVKINMARLLFRKINQFFDDSEFFKEKRKGTDAKKTDEVKK